jgi:exonuclease III
MRFGTWNVRSMCRAHLLKTVAEVLSKNKLDLMGVQEARWDRGDTKPPGKYTFFYGKGKENHELGAVFSYLENQQLKGVEFVSNGISYIVLRCHWCNIIILNVHAPTDIK